VVEFGEWLCEQVIKAVPHRHFILSVPKILRRYFLFDRKLLSEMSRCAWESLKVFFQESVPHEDVVPGAAIALQTFGDFLGFNPHCHVLVTDGCFYGNGIFRVAPSFEAKDLEEIFRHKVFKMLVRLWRIIRAFLPSPASIDRRGFSQERMTYIKEESKVSYQSKDGKDEKVQEELREILTEKEGVSQVQFW